MPSFSPIASALAGACALAIAAAAFAYPDASPWGAANPAADESCGSCHYDYEAIAESQLLTVVGLPERPSPGERYPLRVEFAAAEALDDAAVAGFQLLASAGYLEAIDADVETAGTALRSTAVREVRGGVSWPLVWQAPTEVSAVTFYAAASAANHDNSPFGDVIHYRRYATPVKQLATADESADDPKREDP